MRCQDTRVEEKARVVWGTNSSRRAVLPRLTRRLQSAGSSATVAADRQWRPSTGMSSSIPSRWGANAYQAALGRDLVALGVAGRGRDLVWAVTRSTAFAAVLVVLPVAAPWHRIHRRYISIRHATLVNFVFARAVGSTDDSGRRRRHAGGASSASVGGPTAVAASNRRGKHKSKFVWID